MLWDPEKRLTYLPEEIRAVLREEAGYLHHELEMKRLRVILIPAPDPRHYNHRIRAVETKNPPWYSRMYCERAPVRRDLSLPALERIAYGEDKDFIPGNHKYRYDTLYRHLIFERLTEGYIIEEAGPVPPNTRICTFFELEKERAIPF